MNPEISIIVPIYNVEKYLNKCIESILNQTFYKFELILVDDGSSDKCGDICDEYAKKDNRIKVIHKKNGGLSSARNAGLDIAKGQYIGFIDSDDYINRNMFEILYENIVKYEADISICNFEYIYEDGSMSKNKELYSDEIYILNNIESLDKLYNEDGVVFTVAWNKLYSRKLFHETRYDLGKIHEDEFIIHKLLYKSKYVVYTNYKLYYYLQRKESITQNKFNIKRLDIVYAFKERMDFFKINNLSNLESKAQKSYIDIFFKYYYKVKDELGGYERELKLIKKDFRNSLLILLKNQNFNWKEKSMWIIFSINPRLYEWYNNIK